MRNKNGGFVRIAMTDKPSELGGAWWAKNLEDVDREIVRLSTICNVRILDPDVIERVLKNDHSACGSKNRIAFKKLTGAVTMHYHVREKARGAVGEAVTAALIAEIVDSLRQKFGEELGGS
jgi:hypothetical protein